MTSAARIKRFAALLLAASLLLALVACGQTAATYRVDRSPETSLETSAVPSGAENVEPSDTPRDSASPSEGPDVSASPETSEPSAESSPAPDETSSPDAAETSAGPEIEESASEEPSPEAGSDEESEPSAEVPSGADASPEGTASSGVLYVLNKNTMKFHLPDCSSVGKMKAKNRIDSSESREAIIAKGYSPCKNCNP